MGKRGKNNPGWLSRQFSNFRQQFLRLLGRDQAGPYVNEVYGIKTQSTHTSLIDNSASPEKVVISVVDASARKSVRCNTHDTDKELALIYGQIAERNTVKTTGDENVLNETPKEKNHLSIHTGDNDAVCTEDLDKRCKGAECGGDHGDGYTNQLKSQPSILSHMFGDGIDEDKAYSTEVTASSPEETSIYSSKYDEDTFVDKLVTQTLNMCVSEIADTFVDKLVTQTLNMCVSEIAGTSANSHA